jgi:hypothetical protein
MWLRRHDGPANGADSACLGRRSLTQAEQFARRLGEPGACPR